MFGVEVAQPNRCDQIRVRLRNANKLKEDFKIFLRFVLQIQVMSEACFAFASVNIEAVSSDLHYTNEIAEGQRDHVFGDIFLRQLIKPIHS